MNPEEFRTHVSFLWAKDDFEALEQIASAVRSSRAKFDDGTWKLYAFYQAVADLTGPGRHAPAEPAYERRVGRWLAAKPDSVTPRIVEVRMYIARAWKERGGGVARTVTEEGWKGFRENLAVARKKADEVRALKTDDPVLYLDLLGIAKGQKDTRDETYKILAQGMNIAPDFLPLYEAVTEASLPRWGGEQGEPVELAEWAAKRTADKYGDAIYFFIATEAAATDWADTAMNYHKFAYPRLKQGYEDYKKHFPVTPDIQNLACLFACIGGDRESAKALFDAIGENHLAGYWSRPAFEAWRRWSQNQGPKLSKTPLHEAAEENDAARVKALLSKGADPNALDEVGRVPLTECSVHAMEQNDWEAVRALLSAGADPDVVNGSLPPPLACAMYGPRDIFKVMLKKGSDFNVRDGNGESLLYYAVKTEHEEAFKHILSQKDIDVNAAAREGWTPLLLATYKGSTDMVKAIAQYPGCNVNAKMDTGFSALQLAASSGPAAMVKVLLEHGADVNTQDEGDNTPLMTAIQGKQFEVAAMLLEAGADPNQADNIGWVPLARAVGRRHMPTVDLLLEKGAQVNYANEDGWTVQLIAVKEGTLEILKRLRAVPGVEKNPVTTDGHTLLHQAARDGKLDVVQYLVEQGQDVNAKDKEGKTPLVLAREKGRAEVVAFLTQKGGKV